MDLFFDSCQPFFLDVRILGTNTTVAWMIFSNVFRNPVKIDGYNNS